MSYLWLCNKISPDSCFLITQLSHCLSVLGHLGRQKYPFLPVFISAAAAFGLNPSGLSVEAVGPDMMLVVETWGLGFFFFSDRSSFV